MSVGIGLSAAQFLAYVPVWHWYVLRMVDRSDEPWGLCALGVAILVFRREGRSDPAAVPDLMLPSVIMVVYAATYWFVPHLVQAVLAMSALGCTLSAVRLGVRVHLPTLGLLVLALPVLPSLQFYVGYPLRVLSGALTAPLLQLGGYVVVREGAALRWGTELVSIDAPCSGMKMLWAGLFLAFAVSSFLRLGSWKTLFAAVCSVGLVIFANVWRSAALFYLEAGIVVMPGWCHDAVGVALFAGAALLITRFVYRIGGNHYAWYGNIPDRVLSRRADAPGAH